MLWECYSDTSRIKKKEEKHKDEAKIMLTISDYYITSLCCSIGAIQKSFCLTLNISEVA